MPKTSIDIPYQDMIEVLDRISDYCFAVDRKWQITFVNSSLERKLAIQRQDLLGRNLWDVYPHLVDSTFEQQCIQALTNRLTTRFEHYSMRYQRWFDVAAYPSATGLSVFIREITERKQLEEELRMLSLVAKETENAVIMLSPEQKITWVNAAFTTMTGYSFEEALGQKPSALLLGSETRAEVLHYINAQLQKRLPVQTEIRNYRKTGEPFWAELYIKPLFGANGKLEQFFSIRKEITHRKNLEAELADQQKKIAAAVLHAQEAERAEVGRELHDNVNQILTTAKLYTEICVASPERSTTFLPKCTALLTQTINEIRRLSKQLAAPPIRTIGLYESLCELVDSIQLTKQLTVTLDNPQLSCTTISEELQLATYRIAQEHLTNILKHANASLVTVRLSCSKEVLSLTIQDDGVGFDTTQKAKGMGITNMFSRVALMNGLLSIQSEKGSGCTLNLQFPVSCCNDTCCPAPQKINGPDAV